MTDRLPPNAGKGRPPGSVNKHTKLAKRALAQFVADNVPEAQRLFDKVARADPKAALELLAVFCRFVVPVTSKLQTDVEQRSPPVHLELGISFARGGPGLPRVPRTHFPASVSDKVGVYVTPPHPDDELTEAYAPAPVIDLQNFKDMQNDNA